MQKKLWGTLATFALAIVLSGCQAVRDTASDVADRAGSALGGETDAETIGGGQETLADATAAGWEPVPTPAAYRQLKVGKTAQGQGWAAYYAPNGEKYVRSDGDTTSSPWTATWDEFCESWPDREGVTCTDGSNAVIAGSRVQEYDANGELLASYRLLLGDVWNMRPAPTS
ncbi:MAG: hypothetical protein ACFB6S_03875 [Geminicoccaceae bacterium]